MTKVVCDSRSMTSTHLQLIMRAVVECRKLFQWRSVRSIRRHLNLYNLNMQEKPWSGGIYNQGRIYIFGGPRLDTVMGPCPLRTFRSSIAPHPVHSIHSSCCPTTILNDIACAVEIRVYENFPLTKSSITLCVLITDFNFTCTVIVQ